MADGLRNQAVHIIGDIAINIEAVLEFTENALTAVQLDRVLDVMDTCQLAANNIVNPLPLPPPPPVVVEAVADNMEEDAESGISDA